MRELLTQNSTIHIFSVEEIDLDHYSQQADYTIICAERLDTVSAERLLRKGFSFHDRKLRMEIDIKATSDMRRKKTEKIIDFPMSVKSEITDEMYLLACLAYKTDRRFHLNQQFDQNLADQVIEAYVRELNKKEIFVIESRYGKELLGYTVLIARPEGRFENVLGVTRPGIKGKMIAYMLYNNTLELMAQEQYGSFRKYYGDVSSANLESINLHMQLGAKVTNIYDEYIDRRNSDLGEESGLSGI